MKDKQGFTLLELLMVVVIIAILASIAVPQYLRTAERARMSEALQMLGSMRQSAIRFKTEVGTWAPGGAAITANQLDVGSAAADMSGTPAFTYAVNCGTANGIVMTATRNAAPAIGGNCKAAYVISINDLGGFAGRDCQSIATALTCP